MSKMMNIFFFLLFPACYSKNINENGIEKNIHSDTTTVLDSYYKRFEGYSGKNKLIFHLFKKKKEYSGYFILNDGNPQRIYGIIRNNNTVDFFKISDDENAIISGVLSNNETIFTLQVKSAPSLSFTLSESYPKGSLSFNFITKSDSFRLNSKESFKTFNDRKQNNANTYFLSEILLPSQKTNSFVDSFLVTTLTQNYLKPTGLTNLDSLWQNYRDAYISNIESYFKSNQQSFNSQYITNTTVLMPYNDDNHLSLFIKKEVDNGKRTIIDNVIFNLDLSSNRLLSRNDIFKTGIEDDLKTIILNAILTNHNKSSEVFKEDTDFYLDNNFYLCKEGIVFLLSKNIDDEFLEFEVFVSYENMKNIIKPDFKF